MYLTTAEKGEKRCINIFSNCRKSFFYTLVCFIDTRTRVVVTRPVVVTGRASRLANGRVVFRCFALRVREKNVSLPQPLSSLARNFARKKHIKPTLHSKFKYEYLLVVPKMRILEAVLRSGRVRSTPRAPRLTQYDDRPGVFVNSGFYISYMHFVIHFFFQYYFFITISVHKGTWYFP